MKRLFSHLIIYTVCLLLVLSLSACKNTEITYTVEEMQITRTEDFVEVPTTRRGSSFEKKDMAIKIIRESRSVVEDAAGHSDVSLETYADLILESNRLTLPITREKSCLSYQYTALDEVVNKNYTYYVTLHKSDDAFWLVQFIAAEDSFEDKRNEINTYLDSIVFDQKEAE